MHKILPTSARVGETGYTVTKRLLITCISAKRLFPCLEPVTYRSQRETLPSRQDSASNDASEFVLYFGNMKKNAFGILFFSMRHYLLIFIKVIFA